MSHDSPYSSMPSTIFLVGMMGSGKTTVGRILAQELQWNFVDSDKDIEQKECKSIAQIFEDEGELHFRSLEKMWLNQFSTQHPTIVSTGGGLPIYNDNMTTMKKLGLVLYLKVGINTLWDRLQGCNDRPLLQEKRNLSNILRQRRSIYKEADYCIMGSRATEDIVNTIISKLQA